MTEFEKLEEFINQDLFTPGGNFVQLVKQCIKKHKETERALWLARAERAVTENLFYFSLGMIEICGYWKWVERKCREKAKEFE